MDQDQTHRSGFVGLLGAPNVGKSTWLNLVLGEKVAITSSKPQTTRNRILGVLTHTDAQFVFLDTPGVHQAKNLLGRELVGQALAVLDDVDVVLFMTDSRAPDADEALVIDALSQTSTPVVAAINKIDLMAKPDLLPLLDQYHRRLNPAALVPISAKTGDNVDALLSELKTQLPPGPQYFPPDTLTDQPERFIAAEMIREQVFRRTGQEVPYSTAVTVDEYQERPDLIRIRADVHVERDSQKKIVIGKGGAKLKEIGAAARQDIERMTGVKVFLELFVRVQKKWTKDPRAIRRFGYS